MMYKITNYTKKQAKKYGVVVKPSKNKTKKIDLFKSSKKIASVMMMKIKTKIIQNKTQKRQNY